MFASHAAAFHLADFVDHEEIDVSGLICLHDAIGPCANGVKDAQRTKTHAATERTLSVIWGARALGGRAAAAAAWYRALLATLDAVTANAIVERE